MDIITAGFDGYTAPYRRALGENYTYRALRTAEQVPLVDWRNVFAVIFTGGADISTDFYSQRTESRTHTNSAHDALDAACLEAVRQYPDIIKYGTCRGAQLLWAEYGGMLYQHIDGHHGDHIAELTYQNRHPLLINGRAATASDVDWHRRLQEEGRQVTQAARDERYYEVANMSGNAVEFEITSLHHQSLNWDSWDRTKVRRLPPSPTTTMPTSPVLLLAGTGGGGQTAVEAWYSRSHRMLGFQYHPEWMDARSPGAVWTAGAIRKAANKVPFPHETGTEYSYTYSTLDCRPFSRV